MVALRLLIEAQSEKPAAGWDTLVTTALDYGRHWKFERSELEQLKHQTAQELFVAEGT